MNSLAVFLMFQMGSVSNKNIIKRSLKYAVKSNIFRLRLKLHVLTKKVASLPDDNPEIKTQHCSGMVRVCSPRTVLIIIVRASPKVCAAR